MPFDLSKAFNNPDYNRAEWRIYMAHSQMGGGAKAYFLSNDVETSAYTVNAESTERATIAEYLPTVTNTDGGITFPHEWRLNPDQMAQDAVLAMGLLGDVNLEVDLLFVYGNIQVLEGGTPIADACFAQKSKGKFTISSMGGAGGEQTVITTEGKTSGTIDRGYVTLDASNYDPDEQTWLLSAFTKKDDLSIADLKVRPKA